MQMPGYAYNPMMMQGYPMMQQAPSFEQIQKQMEMQRAQADAFFKKIEEQRKALAAQQQKTAEAAKAAAPAVAAPAATS